MSVYLMFRNDSYDLYSGPNTRWGTTHQLSF